MLADYHVHSEFSDDSWYPVDDICQDAIRRNLDEICFTDHVDYGIKPDVEEFRLLGPSCTRTETSPAGVDEPVLNVDYERYFPKLEEARERWAPLGNGRELGGLSVKIGLEAGRAESRDRAQPGARGALSRPHGLRDPLHPSGGR